MKYLIMAIFLPLLLVGCQTQPATQKVYIPVSIPAPDPGIIERPRLPVLDVPRETIESCEKTGTLCGDIVKALDASLEAAWSFALQQEIILDGYRNQKP